jgi:hydroxymethylglutaryl-CoA lyase
VETISFVRPEWVPQLADADQVFRSRPDRGDVRYPVLVPNPAGLRWALAADASEVAIFGSAKETFSERILNRSIACSRAMFEPVVNEAQTSGSRPRSDVKPWQRFGS